MEQISQEKYLKIIETWKVDNNELIKSGQCKKVFLECLPICNYTFKSIDWENSVNYKIYFINHTKEGWFQIIRYDKKEHALIINESNQERKIYTSELLKFRSGKVVVLQTSDFKIEIGTRFQDDKRDITIIDRKKIQSKNGQWCKYYRYKCNKCGFDGNKHYSVKDKKHKKELWILESSLLNETGCACCSNKIVVENINSIYYTDSWMIPMINDIEFCKTHTHGCNDIINPICIDCGRVKSKLMKINEIYKRKSIGCSCSDGKSYPEKLMVSIFEQLNVNFEMEVVFDWCKFIFKNKLKTGRYDFYFKFNDKNYIIEMDGGWHSKDNTKSGQTTEESKFIDNEKDRLANEHSIEVIRIDCSYNIADRLKYIKQNILGNKQLNELFNLSKIDWNEAEKFACSNLVKIACEYKNNNPKMTSTDISKIMKYSAVSIIKWLKEGNELGWCNYNPKEEQIRIAQNNGQECKRKFSKRVEIFKNGISLGIFESCAELSRSSEELLGIKLDISNISLVCSGKKQTYKKFVFKYV